MKPIVALLRSHPLLSTAFFLSLAVTLFFAARTVIFAVYWADPAHRDMRIAGWMTPGYVAHSWQLPREVMREAIGPLPDERRPTLARIAAEQNVDLDVLVTRIEAAIAAHREADAP